MRNTKRIALIAASVAGVVALAGFGWGHGHSGKFMRKMIEARVDEVLDELQATPDQRTKVAGMETTLIADLTDTRQARKAMMQELVTEFPNDQLDSAALDRSAAPMKEAEQKLKADIRQTVLDLHAVLTPTQRQKLTQIVSEHGSRFGE